MPWSIKAATQDYRLPGARIPAEGWFSSLFPDRDRLEDFFSDQFVSIFIVMGLKAKRPERQRVRMGIGSFGDVDDRQSNAFHQ